MEDDNDTDDDDDDNEANDNGGSGDSADDANYAQAMMMSVAPQQCSIDRIQPAPMPTMVQCAPNDLCLSLIDFLASVYQLITAYPSRLIV